MGAEHSQAYRAISAETASGAALFTMCCTPRKRSRSPTVLNTDAGRHRSIELPAEAEDMPTPLRRVEASSSSMRTSGSSDPPLRTSLPSTPELSPSNSTVGPSSRYSLGSGEQSVCPPLLYDGHPDASPARGFSKLTARQQRERVIEQEARAQRLHHAGIEAVGKSMEV